MLQKTIVSYGVCLLVFNNILGNILENSTKIHAGCLALYYSRCRFFFPLESAKAITIATKQVM